MQEAYKQGKEEGRAYCTKIAKDEAKRQLINSTVLYRALLFASALNTTDEAPYMQDDEVHEVSVTFAKPVALIDAAKDAGYEVKEKGNSIVLAKDGVESTLTVGAASVYIGGEYVNDMAYPIFRENCVVYGSADFTDSLCVPKEE